MHSILQLLGIAAQKAGAAVLLGEVVDGLLCRCVGGLAGGQIALQNIDHIPPVKGIRMVFFRIKKLEGEAHDIQRVAQAERFLTGEEKVALHLFGRHVQQKGDVIGFLPVSCTAIGHIPLKNGIPCGAGVLAAEFRKAQALQVLGNNLDGGAWPRLQLLRLAIDKVGGLCHSTIAF